MYDTGGNKKRSFTFTYGTYIQDKQKCFITAQRPAIFLSSPSSFCNVAGGGYDFPLRFSRRHFPSCRYSKDVLIPVSLLLHISRRIFLSEATSRVVQMWRWQRLMLRTSAAKEGGDIFQGLTHAHT